MYFVETHVLERSWPTAAPWPPAPSATAHIQPTLFALDGKRNRFASLPPPRSRPPPSSDLPSSHSLLAIACWSRWTIGWMPWMGKRYWNVLSVDARSNRFCWPVEAVLVAVDATVRSMAVGMVAARWRSFCWAVWWEIFMFLIKVTQAVICCGWEGVIIAVSKKGIAMICGWCRWWSICFDSGEIMAKPGASRVRFLGLS